MITISSQRYLNDAIVAQKIEAQDFVVLVSPEFEVAGIVVRVVLDGHHSYAAAIEAGASPEFVEATGSDHDAGRWVEGPGNSLVSEARDLTVGWESSASKDALSQIRHGTFNDG